MAKRNNASRKSAKSAKPAESATSGIELRQPDRSGPTKETLLQLADKNSLFKQAKRRQRELDLQNGKVVELSSSEESSSEQDSSDEDADADADADGDDEGIPPRAERILDTLLWCVSLAMLHFTFDVLVQHQYAMSIEWIAVVRHALFAFPVFGLLFYNLHKHPSDPRLMMLPFLPTRLHARLRMAIFFLSSTFLGSYLVHITNNYGYMAVMKQAPPIGCLWIWSVVEMDLTQALASLFCVGFFVWFMGYTI